MNANKHTLLVPTMLVCAVLATLSYKHADKCKDRSDDKRYTTFGAGCTILFFIALMTYIDPGD